MKQTNHAKNPAKWTPAIAAAIYYGLVAWFVPRLGDDIFFTRQYEQFDGLMSWMHNMWLTDNARLDNLIVMAVLATDSRAIAAVASGFVALMAVVFTTILVSGSRDHSGRMGLLVASILIVAFPWRGQTLSIVNYFNTMLPLAATSLFLFGLLYRRGRWWIVAALPLAMIHESYAVATCIALAGWIATSRPKLTTRSRLMLTSYALGTALVVLTPGIFTRLQTASADPSQMQLRYYVMVLMPVWICAVAVAVALITRQRIAGALAVISLCGLPAGAAAMYLGESCNVRTLWLLSMFALYLTCSVARPWLAKVPRWCIMTAATLTAIFAAEVVRWQAISRAENDEVERLMAMSPHGTVFHDLNLRTPKYTLGQPIRNVWIATDNVAHTNDFRPAGKIYCVVPRALEGVTSMPADSIAEIGGCMVTGDLQPDGSRVMWYRGNTNYQRFVTAAGDTLTWIFTSR